MFIRLFPFLPQNDGVTNTAVRTNVATSTTPEVTITPTKPSDVTNDPDRVKKNWPENLTSTPDEVLHPKTVQELQLAVMTAASQGKTPIIARGSMHSWSPVAMQQKGTAIDMSHLDFEPIIDKKNLAVTVSGSMLLSDLYATLVKNGLALTYVSMVPSATVAGTAATDTHGANRDDGHFGDLFTEVRLIDGRGRNIVINKDGCFQLYGNEKNLLIAGDGPLKSVRHSRGVFGAIYQVTLACEPTYDLELTDEMMTEKQAFGDHAENLLKFFDSTEYGSAIWFVQQGRLLMRHADRTTLPRKTRSWFARTIVDGLIRTNLSSAMIKVTRYIPGLSRIVNFIAAHAFPKKHVLRDRWDEIQTYLPSHATKALGLRLMEYGITLDHVAEAIATIKEVTKNYPIPMPMGLRRVGNKVYFEFMWQTGYPNAVPTAQRLEKIFVEKFGADAIPHDGKLFWINPWPRVPEQERDAFLDLKQELDPNGAFTNDYMESYLAGGALALPSGNDYGK